MLPDENTWQKPFFTFLLALAVLMGVLPLVAPAQAEDYVFPLTVGGVTVNFHNYEDVLGDGVFYYDYINNRLHVSGDSSEGDHAIENRIAGLTICVDGDSSLSANASAIRLYADTTITGPGKLTLSAGSVGLYVRSGAELTLQNADLSAKGKWGISGDTEGESLKVVDSVVRARGTSGAVCDFDGGIRLLNDSQIVVPADAVVGTSIFLSDGTTPATGVLIAEPYELTIQGTPVTSANAADILGDGTFSYSEAANTLTINGDFTGTGIVIDSSIWGLTITATGDYTVCSEDQTALRLNADSTITGPGRRLTFSGSRSGKGISLGEWAELTIKDADVKASGYWGIAGEADGRESLRILNSNVTSQGSGGAICDLLGGITLDACAITDPAGGTIQNGAVCAQGSTTPTFFLQIKATEQYDLTIAGTAVTRANAEDVLGNGVFSYDVYTNTLTVNGACLTGEPSAIISRIDGLTIDVTGDSVLAAHDAPIRVRADTVITGPGKLTLQLTASNIGAIYVTDGAELTIQDAKLDATYKDTRADRSILGSDTGESLKIIRSDVNASATGQAISGFDGGITLENCRITSPQGAVIRQGRIYGTTAAPEVTIQALWEYDLAIAGKTVTSYNAADVLGTGVFSYDVSTNTLTVSGDCTASGGTGLVIENPIKGLTIHVARDSVLRSEEKYAIRLYADTTITGRRALTVSAPAVGIYVSTKAALTVRDADIETSGKYGIAGDKGGESLIVSNSNLAAQGTTAAIADLSGGITLEGCTLLSPVGGTVQNGAICEAGGEKAATDVVIQKDQTSGYDLVVAGTAVNSFNAADVLGDGVFSYSVSSNILTVNGDCTGSDCAIESRTDGLIIFVAGDSVLEGQEAALRLYADTTVLGQGKLSLSSSTAGIYVSDGASLTIQDMELRASGKWGITGDSNGESLKVLHAEVTAYGSSGAICDFDGGIRIEDCGISSPSGGSVLYGAICDSRAVTATGVTITTLVTYPLNVTGVAVTSDNAGDILGDGVFSYDANTKTLTVNGDCTSSGSIHVIDNQSVKGLTIYVAGDSTLSKTGSGTCIRLDEDTVITGSGRLTVNADNTAISVWITYDLEIRDAQIVVNAKNNGIYHDASDDTWIGKLIIRNSDVTVTSDANTLYDFRGGIELYDCEIVSPADYRITDGMVYEADGVTQPKTVKIKGEANRSYDLWVAGTQATKQNCANILAGTAGDGVFRYDPETNTLTVKGNYTSSGAVIKDGAVYESDGSAPAAAAVIQPPEYDITDAGTKVAAANAADILGDGVFSFDASRNTLTVSGDCTCSGTVIESRTQGLTIYAARDATLYSEDYAAIRLYADTTVTGPGRLTLLAPNGSGLSISTGAELTVKDAFVAAEGDYGISGYPNGESLRIVNSIVTAKGSYGAICDFDGGITTEDCCIASPENAVVRDGSVYESDGKTRAREAIIETRREYDLRIAGTTVTNINARDILGDGVFSYKVSANTLTVSGDCACSNVVIDSKLKGLTIYVAEDSVLHSLTNGAILLNEETTITGPGKLTLLASGTECCGIFVRNGAALSIAAATVSAEGDYGISGYPKGESLRIVNSTVTVNGAVAAVCDFDGGVTLEGCFIEAPEDAVVQNGTVYESDGATAAKDVTILLGGTLKSEDDREVTYLIDRSTGDVTIGGSVSEAEPAIIAAYDSEGRLLSLQYVLLEGEADAVIPEGAATIVIFWVENTDMQPLCENAVISF